MAIIKKVNENILNTNLTSIANAIRDINESTGVLNFPNNFKQEIEKYDSIENLIQRSYATGSVYVEGDMIRECAFVHCPGLTEIHGPNVLKIGSSTTNTISGSINYSGYFSFAHCSNLSIVDLPKVEFIGYYAFRDCNSLEAIDFPCALEIGSYAFALCSNLSSISIPLVTSINSGAFRGDNFTSIELPSTTYIGSWAFGDCNNLTSISCPSVISIGVSAFNGAKLTGELSFPNVTTIGGTAFYACNGITSISCPNLTIIEDGTFENCSNLTTISFPSVTQIRGYDAFSDCTKLSNINLPALTTITGYRAFENCSSIETLSLPSVTSIGTAAFANCTGLKTLNLPEVQTINGTGFFGCYSITSVSLPKLTTLAGNSNFQNCTGITSISLPALKTISSNAFYNCNNITTTIDLPQVTSIGTYGFYNCTQVPAVNAPKLISAATSVFINNQKCTNYNLPALTTIYASAFQKNYELENLLLPKVTTISGANSFAECSKLKIIDMGPSATNFSGTTTFNNCPLLNKLIIRRADTIAPLANINTFQNTPFAEGGSGGTFYVPQALIPTYQADTNWSVILGYANENEELQNQILPLEGSQYEYYYVNGNPLPYTVTFDTPIYVSKATGQISAFSPTNTTTTVYAQNEYSNSFDFSPFVSTDFDVTILMKDQDITSTAYSVNENIGSIYIEHILGPISITIKFHEITGTQLFTGVSLYTKKTGGSITTPTEGWRTMKSTANASWNIQIIYKGATNLFKQMSALYGHYIRMDLNAEWNQYVSGGLYITPGGFTSITGTPARQAYEQFALTDGKNFNNSVIFKLPDNKDDWQYIQSGKTPANTNYYSSTFYFYSNKNGSITIKSANFYDLGTMEPES